MAIQKEEPGKEEAAGALAVSSGGGALANLDDLFEEAGHEGLEGIRGDEIVLPRLAVLQPTSPLANEEGYRSGNLVNTVSSENFGNSMEFYPLIYWSSRINWVDPTPGSAIDCQARDAEHGTKKDFAHNGGKCAGCPFSDWTEDGQPPHCTLFRNILMLPKGSDTPIVFSAKRTAMKATNRMITDALQLKRVKKDGTKQPVPFYGAAWKIETEKVANDKGTYFVPKFTRLTLVEDAATFMNLRALYAELKKSQDKMVVHQENDIEGDIVQPPDTGDL